MIEGMTTDESVMETRDWKVWFDRKLTREQWDAIGARSDECFEEEDFRFDMESAIAIVKEVVPGIEAKHTLRYMTPKEFQEQGYLQEVNRQFLHPLGLALSIDTNGRRGRFGPIWNCQDDPEGIYFAGSDLSEKAALVREQAAERTAPRVKALGYWIQPSVSETLQNDEENGTVEP